MSQSSDANGTVTFTQGPENSSTITLPHVGDLGINLGLLAIVAHKGITLNPVNAGVVYNHADDALPEADLVDASAPAAIGE